MSGGTVREGSNVDIRCRPHHTWLVAAFGELSMFIRGESKLYGTRTLWVTLGKPAERVVADLCGRNVGTTRCTAGPRTYGIEDRARSRGESATKHGERDLLRET